METDTEEKFVFRRARPLETSLVEWKLDVERAGSERIPSLETSLVEWKLIASGQKSFGQLPWKLP